MATTQTREKLALEAGMRENLGKGASMRLRREGLVPAVVYGEGDKTLSIQVPAKALHRVLHSKGGENALIALCVAETVQGAARKVSEQTVLVKDVQHHPVSHQVIHVDFLHVSLSKAIKVAVPLVFKGEAIGVKQEGGILEHLRWDVEVECLPMEIPSQISVDISGLGLNKTMHVRDIPLAAGIKLITDPERPVVACVAPKLEEEAPAEQAPAEGAEPQVLKQKSPEEIAAEEAERKAKEKKEEKQEKKG